MYVHGANDTGQCPHGISVDCPIRAARPPLLVGCSRAAAYGVRYGADELCFAGAPRGAVRGVDVGLAVCERRISSPVRQRRALVARLRREALLRHVALGKGDGGRVGACVLVVGE